MSNIEIPLNRLFEKHRIVFWFDTDKELRKEFEELQLAGVEKIELTGNEFQVKHRILREQPHGKFLLYHEGPEPLDPLDNWLLDVQLSHGEFKTDQASIHLGDLGLGPEFTDLVDGHLEFFRSTTRKDSLKVLLREKDPHSLIRMKMLAVCTGAEPRIDVILESLLGELAAEREDKIKTLQRANLEPFLWAQLEKHYGYTSATKSVRDFVIELFKSCYAMEMNQSASLNTESIIFLKRWKDSISHRLSFEKLSNECAAILNIQQDLQVRDYKDLQETDFFRLIDQKIISDLVRAITDRTISAGECALVIRSRRQGHWYSDFGDLYEAVEYASSFIFELENLNLQVESFSAGITKYSNSWFRIDQLYRKYIYHEKQSGQTSLLEKLTGRIEDLYANTFLLKLGDLWQQQIDKKESWQMPLLLRQDQFFESRVLQSSQKKKMFVIISDAFRYEIGEEFVRLIQSEDRYDAQLEPMISMLPSNTQVGMAALLPHKELSFAEGEALTVLADGASTLGTVNRGKVLKNALAGNANAMKADEFLDLNKDDCRELIRSNDVVYIYHNRIDATGDKKESEGKVFAAVEETLQDLLKIVKKLAGNNATNMLVTSDHGFIYQNKPLDESDFSTAEVQGDAVFHQDRRFVLGKGLVQHSSLKYFTSEQLGFSGQMEVQISKATYRMRLKGSGSRFVHGGASLQEIVVPVVRINKKRQSDVSSVSVDIIRSSSTVITSGQLSVAFYQADPVSAKKHPRILRAGIYSKTGLTKSVIREKGRHKVIDKIGVQLNDKDDVYEATFSNLGVSKILVDADTIKKHPKLLVGGVWCISDLEYEPTEDKRICPWVMQSLKPIQLSHFDYDAYIAARKNFTTEEWIDLLLQSIGFNPEMFGARSKLLQLVRLIPFCERNYNLIELGPKGTGKSHIYSEFSPHGILISGGEVTVPKLFVNNSNGKLGLVGYWDAVAFDEFAGHDKKPNKALVDIMKNYMANKTFSRGVETLGAEASMVFVGNTQHNVPYMLKHTDLFDELPSAYHDSAFLDRLHFYIPGWEIDIIRGEMFSDGYGFVVDYLAEILKNQRNQDFTQAYTEHFQLLSDISTRDRDAIQKTFSGFMKVLFPHGEASKDEVEVLLQFAIEGRKRVKDQLMRIDSTYTAVQFGYTAVGTGKKQLVKTLEEKQFPQHYYPHGAPQPEQAGADNEQGETFSGSSTDSIPKDNVLNEELLPV